MEFINLFKNYLLSQKSVPTMVTVKNYLADIKQFIGWVESTYQKPFSPQSITIQTIHEFKKSKENSLSASSVERHISSLRKFFTFLKLNGTIAHSPFDFENKPNPAQDDPWHLRDFKNYLYVYNASNLTIKNYIIDVKQFLSWAEEVLGVKSAWNVADKDIFGKINNELVEEYKNRLVRQEVFSASSINRKLSSLRKYLSWAAEQGHIKHDLGFKNYDLRSQVDRLDGVARVGWTEQSEGALAGIGAEARSLAGQGQNSLTGPHTQRNELNYSRFPKPYSKIPPIRLFQKIAKVSTLAFDLLIVSPIAFAFRKVEHGKWALQGKPLFKRIPTVKFPAAKEHLERLQAKNPFKIKVKNISKEIYAPLSVSIADFPWYKKVIHHARYTRPQWYHKYHQLAVAHYFNWAVLIIFSAAIGFGMYNNFVATPGKSLAALPTAGKRVLSFQGRLTDASDNPITSPSWIRFIVYNDSSASGSARLWEEVDKVSPDQDGIFSIYLGSDGAGGEAALCNSGNPPSSPASTACGIPQSLFAQNSALWLGVSVENTTELQPREQIATVAYAVNSETLQGLPPLTQGASGSQANANTVLVLDSAGNLDIGQISAKIQSSTGQFTLSGKTLVLQSGAGFNGNITLAPDGSGYIDLQKPLQNSTLNNNIPSAAGAVEIDDLTAILATSSGQSALTINQNGTGPIISASHSGTAEFTLDAFGNGTFNGNVTGNTFNGVNLSLSGNVTSDLVPGTTDLYSLGSDPNVVGGKEWLNLYVKNIYSNGQLVGADWQRNLGVLSPLNITDDLAIGGTATSTAKFQVFGSGTNAGSATLSGSLTFFGTSGTNLITARNNAGLTIGDTQTGDISINPVSLLTLNGNFLQSGAGTLTTGSGLTTVSGNLTVLGTTQNVGNGGNYTIQTSTNGALSLFSAGSGNIVLGQNAGNGTVLVQPNAGGQASLIINNQGTGDLLTASASGATEFTVSRTGGVYGRKYYDLDNTSFFLDPAGTTNSLLVAGTIGVGTINPLSWSGMDIEKDALGNAALVVANLNTAGDLFTASNSAGTKFTIANDGSIKNNLIPNLNNTYSLGSDPATGGREWLNLYAQNIYSSGQLLTSVWQRNAGVLSPLNITDDLAIGGTATSTAKFQVFGLTGNATTSGSLTFNTTGLIQTTNMNPLTIGSASTGPIQLSPKGTTGVYIDGTGKVGVGTASPTVPLQVNFNSNALSLGDGTNASTYINIAGSRTFLGYDGTNTDIQSSTGGIKLNVNNSTFGSGTTALFADGTVANVGIGTTTNMGNAQLVVNQTAAFGIGDIIAASASGATEFRVSPTGGVYGRTYFDLDSSSFYLDPAGTTNSLIVAGTIGVGTLNPLSWSGIDIEKDALGNAVGVFNQQGNGDILTASSAGQAKFTIQKDGTIVSGKYTTAGGVFYTTSAGVFTQASNASANTVLHGGATPSFSAVDLGNDTTGTLPISKGGTNGSATPTNGQVAYGTGTAYAFTSGGSTGNCLTFNSGSAPSWAACSTGSSGTNYWQLVSGAISPVYPSVDILAGSTATTSAKFAVTGIAGSLTPAASVSATVASGGTGTGIVMKGDGTIQSLINGPLTIGGNTTGNIKLSPLSGNGTVTVDGVGLDTTSGTFDLLATATTINAGATAGTFNFRSNTIDSNQATLNLFATPTTINFGAGSTNLNLSKSGSTTTVLGAFTVNGNTTLGTNTSNSILLNGLLTGAGANNAVQPGGASGTTDLGSALHYWGTVYANNFISPVSGGTSGFWQLTSNVLSPVNFWNDLAVGGNATGSATPFQIFATQYTNNSPINSGIVAAGTATTSGNLTFRGTNTAINLLNGTGLNIYGSFGGDFGLGTTPLASLSNTGSLTLNNNLAVNGGNITTTNASANIFTNGVTTLLIGGSSTNITLQGNVTLGSSGSNKVFFTSVVQSDILPSTTGGPYNLGGSNNVWGSVYAQNLFLPSSGGTGGYWQLSNVGVLSPANISNDLAVGGTATSSAAFQVFAKAYTNNLGTVPAGTATTSGFLTFRGTPGNQTVFQQNMLNGANLGFYTSVGGDAGISTSNPALYIQNNGNLGIGYNAPLETLTLNRATGNNVIGFKTNGTSQGFIGVSNSAGGVITGSSIGDLMLLSQNNGIRLSANSGTSTNLFINGIIGNTGIGTSTLLGNAQLIVNQTNVSGLGDIFTASAAGSTKFTIANDGTIKNSLIPNLTDTYNLGSDPTLGGKEWDTIYVRQIVTPSTGGLAGFWQLSALGVLSPSNTTNDLAIGGNATSSANFQVFARAFTTDATINSGIIPAGTATTSGNITFRGTLGSQSPFQVNYLNGSSLGFYPSVGGDKGITSTNPTLFLAANGKVGIGTTNPVPAAYTNIGTARLELADADGSNSDFIQRVAGVSGPGFAVHYFASSNGTLTSPSAMTAGTLGQISFVGFGTTDYQSAAAILGRADGTFTDTSSPGYITFETTPLGSNSRTERLRITSSGSVGIGTTSPLTLSGLHVEKNSLGNAVAVFNQLGNGDIITASASGTTEFIVSKAGNVYGRQFTDLDNSIYYLDPAGLSVSASVAGSMTFTPASEHDINFLNNSNINFQSSVGGDAGLTSRLFIQGNNGNVGIGTTSPDVRLEIASQSASTEILGSPHNSAILIKNTNSAAFNEKAELQFAVGNNITPNAAISALYTSWSSPGGSGGLTGADLVFSTKTATTLLSEKMRITGAGNVGIGTTSPGQNLHIYANSNSSIGARIENINTGSSAYAQLEFKNDRKQYNIGLGGLGTPNLADKLFVWDNSSGSARLTIDTTGNVGIGTTSPTDALEVAGSATTNQGNIQLADTAGNSASRNWRIANGWSAYGDLQFLTGTSAGADPGTPEFTIQSNGNVGIGTTSPNTTLQVNGDFSIGPNNVALSAGSNGPVFANVSGFGLEVSTFKFGVAINNGTSPNFVIDNSGQVGIGNASPHEVLDVAGPITTEGQGNGTYPNNQGGYFGWNSTNGVGETDFVNHHGGGSDGGFRFYDTANGSFTPTSPIASINKTGNLSITFSTPYTRFVCKSGNGGGGFLQIGTCGANSQSGDWAENVYAPSTEPGDIAQIDPNAPDQSNLDPKDKITYVAKSQSTNAKTLVGVMSATGMALDLPSGTDTTNYRVLALAGVIGVKVSLENGPIHKGDVITSSSTPGVGMVATKPTLVVAKALENFDGSTATQAARLINGKWEVTNGTCQSGESNCYAEAKISGLAQLTWYDPDVYLTSTGNMSLIDGSPSVNFTIPHYYTLNDALGKPIDRMGAFLELAVGNLRAGILNTQQIITNSLAITTANVTVAGQSLHDYIAGIVSEVMSQNPQSGIASQSASVKTNIISPLDNSNIALRVNNSRIEIAKDASSSAVASIDNSGNATFSGTLNSQNLAVNGDATIAGTLHANRIEANSIEGLEAVVSKLSAQNMTNITNISFATPSASPTPINIATGSNTISSPSSSLIASNVFTDVSSLSSYFAYVPNLKATTGIFTDGLTSLGPTSLADTTIAGQLSIGAQMILADTSLNVIGSDFAIQPLRQGGINFEGGLIAIDTSGNLTVNGNATFNANVAVKSLSPVDGKDLNINLGDSSHPELVSGSNLNVNNASGSAVFSINQLGDVVASGTANISKLNFSLVEPAMAISDTEVKTSGSAGTAAIKAHQTEVTIDNPNVTDKSLIYITPVGTNETPYLERQVSGKSFTVGIPNPLNNAVNFNWLIVN